MSRWRLFVQMPARIYDARGHAAPPIATPPLARRMLMLRQHAVTHAIKPLRCRHAAPRAQPRRAAATLFLLLPPSGVCLYVVARRCCAPMFAYAGAFSGFALAR